MKTQSATAIMRTRSSLRERVLSAGTWSIAGYALSQAIRFGTNLVMTRLLVPEMFGVMAVALMVMLALALFSDIGLRLSVVQHQRGSDPIFLDTVWVTKICFGVGMAGVAALIGLGLTMAAQIGMLPSGSAYAAPELPHVITALGFGAVIAGAESTRSMEASRYLTLARVTKMQIAAQIVAVLCMVALAVVHRSIWVLVVGSLVTSAVTTLLSHTWLPGTPNRARWDLQAFKEIFGYGKWVLLSSIVGFCANAGDKMLLGGLATASVFGIYSIAFMLMSAIENAFVKVISDVTFPALSEVARDPRRNLRAALYRFYVPLAALCIASAGMLFLASPAIVSLLYDDRYVDAGWMLQILSLALVAVPSRVHAMCLLALGKARAHSNLALVRLLVLMTALPLSFNLFGMPGAVWSVVLCYVVVIPVSLLYSSRQNLLDARIEVMVAAATCSLIAAAAFLGDWP